jgi:regulator of sirC expression with transglutaminase-like and TPR domain
VIGATLFARKKFIELVEYEESVFPLDRAAMLIALEEYPNLEVDAYLRKLDTLAVRVEVLTGHECAYGRVIESMNEVLFVQEALRGNTEEYYDPRNSFLNDVLDRKLGVPISLSIIYMEVARRIGFPIEGVGFPGHFLVKCTADEREILIDPYQNGRILSAEDCQELLNRVYGNSVTVQPAYLHSMGKKSIITRVLYNLKGLYYQQENYHKALSVVDRILLLNPGLISEIRDRGLLYMQTSLFSKALADLEYYLEHAIAPQDTAYIEAHIKTLRGVVASAN